MKFLNPAEYVIKTFGGVRATARAIGRDKSSVSVWRASKAKKGTGGLIPHKAQALILKVAREKNLDITPEDLILGRLADE